MLIREHIIELRNDLLMTKSLDSSYLIGELLDTVLSLDFEKIDQKKSALMISDTFRIDILGEKNKFCDLYFEVLDDNIIDIQIGKGGCEYLYYFKVDDYSKLNKLKLELNELLKMQIQEELTYCNERIIKAHCILIDKGNLGLKNNKEYKIVLGNCLFNAKKSVIKRNYDSWV